MAGLIEDYAIVGDMQSAALIGRDGSVDWLCVPRFDSAACMAALLGDEGHGQWRISPAGAEGVGGAQGPAGVGPGEVSRRYEDSTLILETEWRTAGGIVRVIDFMPPRDCDTPRASDAPVLVRIVEGVQGAVEMECVWRLRFDYGKVVPWVRRINHAIVAIAGPDSVWLRTPVKLVGRDMAHEATFTVRAGEAVPFVFSWTPSHLGEPSQVDAAEALAMTRQFWADWTGRCSYRGQYRDAVVRSLITLKALTYAPTGGIVAAATTSLPEDIGGVRNWDYRYCWLRDATITLEALLRTGYTAEASQWREWLGRAIAGDPRDVQIMYGVAGERRLEEWQADWLPGYENSAPVRIGNAAVTQRQLDVYGEVIDAITLGRKAGLRFDSHTWSLVRAQLRFLEKNWNQPDEGIWEVRGPRRHFVHSKVMAWVAFDRAIRVAELGKPGAEERWRAIRDQIHAEVCEQGYDSKRGTFTQYYGSTELDAAVLLIPEVGFLPPADPRVVSTVEAIQRELTSGGLVLRYTQPGAMSQASPTDVDGLAGGEGAFLACSFWLVNALHLIGRYDEAEKLFDRLLSLRNDVGLLSEEYDPRYSRLVGNFPQAFSHMPLIQSALNLEEHAGHHCRRPARKTSPAP
ncbi:MAG TPA: glycoside hydrolase family 15 protein [Streptosporangiaceae bacterium]|nr:glycoside hydrolase family 15 protein [Streptosporangiaceae bacterium]